MAMAEKRGKSALRTNAVDFGAKTTFHGVRYVLDVSSCLIQRFIWGILVLSCFGLLLFQVIDRILYYNSMPVSINVKVNYNNSLRFPGVTICNQNAFKSTSSADLGRYNLIVKMFTNLSTIDDSDLHAFKAENLSLTDLHFQSSHLKEDLLMSCIYNGKTCDHNDFHEMATDLGVCFTFESTGEDRYISSPGVENGLQLLLNVEQYEYMLGPHGAAGIKILLHEPGEIPRVYALGQAISPGAHVFVGVKYVEVNNLPKPHGSCQDIELEYVDVYTKESCQLNCLTMVAMDKCGCRHIYFPHKNDTPPVCSLSKYFGCLKDVIDTFPRILDTACFCPLPCNFGIYETDISYAVTSEHALESVLNSNVTQDLSYNIIRAAEVTSRYEHKKFQKTKLLALKFNEEVVKIETVLTRLSKIIQNCAVQIKELNSNMLSHYTFKENLFRYQIYIVQKNFIRPRDAMEERTVHIVGLGYAELILTVENKIRKLADNNFTDESARLVFYESTMEILSNRKEIILRAMHNYTQLIEAYETGVNIFRYKFKDIPREHNFYATPKYLLRESRVHNNYAVEYGTLYYERLNKTIDVINLLINLTENAYQTGYLEESEIVYGREEFRYLMRNWVFARSVFYYETIEWPIRVLISRVEEFDEKWNDFSNLMENVNQSITSLQTNINMFYKNVFINISNIKDNINMYLKGFSSKMNISLILTSERTYELITKLEQFFQDARARESSLCDWLSRMQQDSNDIWRTIANDIDSMDYYEFFNKTEYFRNLTDIMGEIASNYTSISEHLKISNIIDGNDSSFTRAFSGLVKELDAFKDSVKIDSEFIRNNFLQLNIFFRQMSYEDIKQQAAYDIFALWCDIGGSMGLFLGASVLSIFELFDLLSKHILRNVKIKEHLHGST